MARIATTNQLVLLFGSNGYVGSKFSSYLASHGYVFYPVNRKLCDGLDKDKIYKTLLEIRPDFLVNCAGYTGKPNVDACESNKEDTYEGNVTLPMNIGEVCEDLSIPWGHVSSGCIYNGYDKDYTEEDEPNFSFEAPPCSYYSGTKAEAEKKMLEQFSNCYIWRLRIPFNEYPNPRNYLQKLLKYEVLLSLPNSVSNTDDFVKSCMQLHRHEADYGIYNVVNGGAITAREVISLFKEKYTNGFDRDFKFIEDADEFYKVTGAEALRSNCILDNAKLLNAGVQIRNVVDAMRDSIDKWPPF